jgi:hypothetical protein
LDEDVHRKFFVVGRDVGGFEQVETFAPEQADELL